MICSQCNAVDTPHFTYKRKDGTEAMFSKCKKCHNAGRYVKKGAGWNKLPADQVAGIRERLALRRTVKDVADQFNIPLSRLQSWIRRGIKDV